MTGGRVRNDVLFRWDPEYEDFDIEDRCNEENSLKGSDSFSFDRLLVQGLNHSGIITRQTYTSTRPVLVP